MPFYQIGTLGLLLAQAGVYSADLSAAPPPPSPSTITPYLEVEYVDTDGNRQTTEVIDAVTTITGVAPFPVQFDGYGSVSEQTDSDTADEAFWNLGCLIDYGEGLGGTWSVSGRPKDTDRGPPIFGHVYTTAGTFSARMTLRDSAGNQNFIRVNVVVTSPGAGVDMTSGVIPTFASNTVYNAPAGGTWGNIANQLDGLHNVIIRKTGSGADPVFGTVTLEGRYHPGTTVTRTRGIRFLNCDVATVAWSDLGFDYCAFVGGHLGQISLPPMEYYRDQIFDSSYTATQASNVRMARGLFLQDTGELTDANSDSYVLIGEARSLHLKNVIATKATAGNHNIRGVFKNSSFRHILTNNTNVSTVSYYKLQGWACTLDVSLPTLKGTPDPWQDDDTVADYANARRYGLPSSKVVIVDFQCGDADGYTPAANAGAGPQNNDLEPAEGCELVAYEYGKYIQTSTWYNMDFTGRHIGRRDVYLDLGDGALVGGTFGENHPNRTPDGWAGPYYTTGTRPVVVP